jgi:hypothetical protein
MRQTTDLHRTLAKEVFALASYVVVSFYSVFRVLLSPGVISYLFDWDIPPFTEQFQTALTTRIYSWNPFQVMGIPYTVGTDTFYYFFLKFLSPLGGAIVSKFILLFVFSLSGFGMYHLCRALNINPKISWASGLFYMLTPFTYLEIMAGHIPSVFSYAVAPIYLFFLIRALRDQRLKNVLISGLVLAVAWTYIDFVVILLLLSLTLCLALSSPSRAKLRVFLGSHIEALGLHSFWVLPLLNDMVSGNIVLRTAGEASRLYIRLSVVFGSSAPLTDTLRLKAFFIGDNSLYWPQFWTGQTVWIFLSFLVPMFVFTAVLLRREKVVAGLALAALMGVVLTSGVTVLGPVYSWLILNVPYFNIFTAVHRWLPLAIIPYSILIGMTFDEIAHKLAPLTKYLPTHISASLAKMQNGISLSLKLKGGRKKEIGTILAFVILLSLILGFSGSFFMLQPRLLETRLHTYPFNQGEEDIYRLLADTPGDFRIANYPLLGDLGIPGLSDAGADPMGVYPPKPAIQFGQGFSSISDPAAYTRFLSLTSYLGKTSDIDKLLGLSNVRYIIYYQNRIDEIHRVLFSAWYPGNQSESLEFFFKNQRNLKVILNNGDIVVYENPNYTPHIYTTDAMDIITGDRSVLLAVAKLDNYSLTENALVFSRQIPFAEADATFNLSRGIIVFDNNFIDLIAPYLSADYIVNPGFYSTTSKWISIDNEWWGKWRFASSENFGDGLFTRGPNEAVNITYNAPETTEYEIWANLYYDSLSFSTSFKIDDTSLSDVNTYLPVDAGFKWTYLGSAHLGKGSHTIEAENGETGTSALLQLLVIPEDVISSIGENVNRLIGNKPLTLIAKPLPTTEELLNSTQLLQDIYFVLGADRSSNLDYIHSFQDNSFKLTATFNQTGNVNEAVLAHLNLTKRYSLSVMQSLKIGVRLQEPAIQFFEVKFELDTNDDGVIDSVVPVLNTPSSLASGSFTELSFNVASLAQIFKLDAEQTKLLGLQLVFQKAWGTDLSENPKSVTFEIDYLNIHRNKQLYDIEASFGNAIISNAELRQLVPRDGDYEFLVRVSSDSNATLELSIGGNKTAYTNILSGREYRWASFGTLHLREGNNTFMLDSQQFVKIDLLVVKSTNDGDPITSKNQLTFEKISPTEYRTRTDSNEPYFLVFMENYDPAWVFSGSHTLHLQAYALGNLFYVENPESEMTLIYTRQFLFSAGLTLSGILWIMSAVALLVPVNLWKRIPHSKAFFRK